MSATSHTVPCLPLTRDKLPDVEINDFTIASMPARFAALGEVHEGIDDAVWDIEPFLEWADRDEHDRGLRDALYPPNVPKQEGEPLRAQPSRARRRPTGAEADASAEQPQDPS